MEGGQEEVGSGSAAAASPPLKREDGIYTTLPLDRLGLLQAVLLSVVEGEEKKALQMKS